MEAEEIFKFAALGFIVSACITGITFMWRVTFTVMGLL